MTIKNWQDFGAGCIFAAIGLAGLWIGCGYRFGSLVRMGPGFMPVVVSSLVMMLGILIIGKAAFSHGAAIEATKLRPLILIPGAVIAFALMIPRFGLVPSVLVTAMIAGRAAPDADIRTNVVLSVSLVLFSLLLFRFGLNLPIPAW